MDLALSIGPLSRQGGLVTSPRPNPPIRSSRAGLLGAIAAMAMVGGSVGVSGTLVSAALFTAQAIRYAAAGLLLGALARGLGVQVPRPRGREWAWLAGVAVSGLVVFNIAIVRGT